MRQSKRARHAGCSDATRSQCCGGWCFCTPGQCQCDERLRPVGTCCWPEGFTGELSGLGEEVGETVGGLERVSGEGNRSGEGPGQSIRDANGTLDASGVSGSVKEVNTALDGSCCARKRSSASNEEEGVLKLAEAGDAGLLESGPANHIGAQSLEERGGARLGDGLVRAVEDICGERRKHERLEQFVQGADVLLDESNPFSMDGSRELVQAEGLLEDDPFSVNIGLTLPMIHDNDVGSCGCGPGPCVCDPHVVQARSSFGDTLTVPEVSARAGMVAGERLTHAEREQECVEEGVETNEEGRAPKEVPGIFSGSLGHPMSLDGRCCNANSCRCGRGLCHCAQNAEPRGSCCSGPRTLPNAVLGTRMRERARSCCAMRQQQRKEESVEVNRPVRDALNGLDIFSGNVGNGLPSAERCCSAKNCRCGPERCRCDPNSRPPGSCCSGPRTVPKLTAANGTLEWSGLQFAGQIQNGREEDAVIDEQSKELVGNSNILSESLGRAMSLRGHCCKASNCGCGPETCRCDPSVYLSDAWGSGARAFANAAASLEAFRRVGWRCSKHQQKESEETKMMNGSMKEVERFLESFSGRVGHVVGLDGQCLSCTNAILGTEQCRCRAIGLSGPCSTCKNSGGGAEWFRRSSDLYRVGCPFCSGAGTLLKEGKPAGVLTGGQSCRAERGEEAGPRENLGSLKTVEVGIDSKETRGSVEISEEDDLISRLLEKTVPELPRVSHEKRMRVGRLEGEAKDLPCSGVEDKVGALSSNKGLTEVQRKEEEKDGVQGSIESFQCKECDSGFKNKRELTYHTRTVHRGERIFKCDRCSEGFFYKQNRDRHITEVHLSQRPYSCPVEGCGVAFKNRGGLKQHQKTVHNKERPYRCPRDGCNRAFGQRNHLTHHIATVHEKKRPFKCGHCEYRFSNRGNLNQHIRRKHPGVLQQNGEKKG